MNFVEFIKMKYPIEEKLAREKANPITVVMENDDLPYDDIKLVDGTYQKVVELSNTEFIPVIELLSLNEKYFQDGKDKDLEEVWNAYKDQVELAGLSIAELSDLAEEYQKMKRKREKLINVSSSQV